MPWCCPSGARPPLELQPPGVLLGRSMKHLRAHQQRLGLGLHCLVLDSLLEPMSMSKVATMIPDVSWHSTPPHGMPAASVQLVPSGQPPVTAPVMAPVPVQGPSEGRVWQVHCSIACDTDGHWALRDDGSLNGSMVNGRKVAHACLREGDIITLGNGGTLLANRVLRNWRDHDVVFRFDCG